MNRQLRWVAVALVALVASFVLVTNTGRTAPADSADFPVAFDAWSEGDLYLAMHADVDHLGGLARMSPSCFPVARWRTADIVDVSIDRSYPTSLWALEIWPGNPGDDRRVQRYSLVGAPGDWFPVSGTARFLQLGREIHSATSELFILHQPGAGKSARVAVYGADGALRRAWDVPGEPQGLGVSQRRGDDRPIYVVVTGQPGRSGTLLRYTNSGGLVWEKPLDLVPVGVSVTGDLAVVAGVSPDAPGGPGLIVHVDDEARGIRTWPLVDFVPFDLVADGPGGTWVLGHRPGQRSPITLGRYESDGALLSSCGRFPQPSMPTPEGTVACPKPTAGVETWRYPAKGNVAAVPAVSDEDGTVYIATTEGLLYAVDCTGRGKWLFDYRLESPQYFGVQAFEAAPAVDKEGTIYIGDDVVVPNFFFSIGPDGKTKWVKEYESLWSQIDASPALSADGFVYTAAHGTGAGVTHGAILVYRRDGTTVRPGGDLGGEDGVGPITDGPAVLADGASVAYLSAPFEEWVLPTGTLPTITSVPPRPTRTPTYTTTPATATMPPTATVSPTITPSPGAPPTVTMTPVTPTGEATEVPPHRVYLPRVVVPVPESVAGGASCAIAPARPLPPPYVTQPVPSRLRLVQAGVLPDVVMDLPGLSEPSSPAVRGNDIWFTALANDGAHLLAFRAGEPPTLLLDWNIHANGAASPVLGRFALATGFLEVLLMGDDGRLVSLDASAETGRVRLRWSHFIGEPAAGAPALGDDGRVYVAAGQVVQSLERGTGAVVWSVPLDSPASGSVNLAPGGMLYVATESGVVLAIGTSAAGLDPAAAWPAVRHDARNTGSGESIR